MKIGIVTEYYYPSLGGITEHVHHFAMEARALGLRPVIITGNAGLDPNVDPTDIEIIRLGKSLPIFSNGSIARVTCGFNLGRRVKEIFDSEKFDVIHIHSPFAPNLPILAQRYTNTVTFATFHTQFDNSNFLRLLRGKAQEAFNYLHGRIAVSRLCIESMDRYVRGSYRIIPNGVDTEKFNGRSEKISKFDDGKLNIFFLSRLEPRNGLGYLIDAFSKIRKERDDARLIIGGDGPLKKRFESLVPAHAKDDIHFVGRINGVRPNYYATADIFCFPTTRASFGITILEAMASARPVVAFSLPAYEGIIQQGEEGVLCGPPNADGLAAAINDLLDSPSKRKKIGMNARLRSEEFSWKKITRQVIDYYEDVRKDH